MIKLLFNPNLFEPKKKCVVYPQEDFLYLKYMIGLLDSSKLITTKIIMKKSVKNLKRGGICRLDPKSYYNGWNTKSKNFPKKVWLVL
jgi:hypothetical protein